MAGHDNRWLVRLTPLGGCALDDLLKDGKVQANAPVQPGDILIIPQSWF